MLEKLRITQKGAARLSARRSAYSHSRSASSNVTVASGKTQAKDCQSITSEPFGAVGGTDVSRYTLTNCKGMVVKILTYGGIIQEVWVPDQQKHLANVTLGFAKLNGSATDSYVGSGNSPYFGALIGRYGNRIAGGQFQLNGQTYQLPLNNGPNSLHGGTVGFDKHVWDVDQAEVGANGAGARAAPDEPRRRSGLSRRRCPWT